MTTSVTPKLPLRRRIIPALGLIFLAPWVGEYLLGNISIRDLIAIPFLAPLYGGGALLIREVTRRTGRGWPTMLLLAAAYGVIEAGLVDQSLFNPSFEGYEFQKVTPIPVLGISATNTIAFIVGHIIWSIGIPIAIVEMLSPGQRKTPWLGRFGLMMTFLFYLLGCWIIFQDLYQSEDFLASPGQLIGAAATALAFIVLAFRVKPRSAVHPARPIPPPLALGIGAFLISSLFMLRPENWWGVGLAVLILIPSALAVWYWSRQASWSLRHEFALVAGLLPTYAWLGFVLTAIEEPDDPVRWLGNVIFALFAGLLLLVAWRRVKGSEESPVN